MWGWIDLMLCKVFSGRFIKIIKVSVISFMKYCIFIFDLIFLSVLLRWYDFISFIFI